MFFSEVKLKTAVCGECLKSVFRWGFLLSTNGLCPGSGPRDEPEPASKLLPNKKGTDLTKSYWNANM